MFCTNCGSQLPEDALFCPNCGEQVMMDEEETKEEIHSFSSMDQGETLDDTSALSTDIANENEANESVPEKSAPGAPDENAVYENAANEIEADKEDTADEDFSIPDIEKTVVITNYENPEDLNPQTSSTEEPVSEPTIVLGDVQFGDTFRYAAEETPQRATNELEREDTQTVFNEIQESLAHPDIDFEHSQGTDSSMDHFSGREETVHMYPGNDTLYNGANEENNTVFSVPQMENSGAFIPPSGPGNIPGSHDMNGDGDGDGQKPRQQKKIGLIIGIAACAVVVIAVVIVLAVMLTSSSRQRRQYQDQIDQAEEYMSESDYDKAIEAFRKAIEIDDQAEDAYVGLADAYIKNKEYGKAADALNDGSKATGSKERIEEKKQELIELDPTQKPKFEDNSGNSSSGGTSTPSSTSTPPSTSAPPASSEAPVDGSEETTPTTESPDNVTPDSPGSEQTDTDAPAVDEGKGDEGSGDEGKGDEGSGDEGKGDEGSDDEGKGDEGSGDEGKGDEGSGDEGKGDEGSGDDGQGDVITVGTIQYQMKEYYHETKLPNGEVGAYTQITYPYFMGETDVAAGLNSYMEKLIDTFSSSEDEVSDYTGEEDISFPLYDKADFEVTYGSDGIVSMKYTYATANTKPRTCGLIFSGSDGSQLGWADVLNASEDDLAALIKTYYDADKNNLPVEEFLKRVSSDWNNCYINGEGISFIASGDESIEVLIPFSESGLFKFLDAAETPETSESNTQKPDESKPETEPDTKPETEPETQAPETTGFSWIVQPSLAFEDVLPVMDDGLWGGGDVDSEFPLTVYKKDGKLGLMDYNGNVLSDPIYNMVYGCASASNQAYTMYASLMGSDVWTAKAVDTATGQASGAEHLGHGGVEMISVYSRSDGKVYNISGSEYGEGGYAGDSVIPIAVVDDPASVDFMSLYNDTWVGYGLLTPSGTLVDGVLYDRIYENSGDRFVAMSQGKYGVIDASGNVIIPFEYEGAIYLDFNAVSQNPGAVATREGAPYAYHEGYIALKKDGMWGYFDVNGNCLTGMVFEEARAVHQGHAYVKQNGQWGVIEITPQS